MSLIDPFQSEKAVSNLTRMGEYLKVILIPFIQNIVQSLDTIAGFLNDEILDPVTK